MFMSLIVSGHYLFHHYMYILLQGDVVFLYTTRSTMCIHHCTGSIKVVLNVHCYFLLNFPNQRFFSGSHSSSTQNWQSKRRLIGLFPEGQNWFLSKEIWGQTNEHQRHFNKWPVSELHREVDFFKTRQTYFLSFSNNRMSSLSFSSVSVTNLNWFIILFLPFCLCHPRRSLFLSQGKGINRPSLVLTGSGRNFLLGYGKHLVWKTKGKAAKVSLFTVPTCCLYFGFQV
jgi:hypothetical protein